jgi:3-methyladenine DNA glycosylase AlkD
MAARTPANRKAPAAPLDVRVEAALAWLKQKSTRAARDGMARYGLPSDHAMGVSVANIQLLAKQIGRDHELAGALWKTGWYEARLLTAFVGDPARLSAAEMDRWCRDFDNWGTCDTLCFKLFDQSPHAWSRVTAWSGKRDEFVRRAAFALLASLALHDKDSGDAPFLRGLRLIERAAVDERNFVKKGVSWALRLIGRRNQALNDAAIETARRLIASPEPSARWIGKGALKELTGPVVRRRLAARAYPRGAARR